MRGLSQLRLAKLAGTSQAQIDRLEKGQRDFDEDWRKRLAKVFRIKPSDLFYPEDILTTITGCIRMGGTVEYATGNSQGGFVMPEFIECTEEAESFIIRTDPKTIHEGRIIITEGRIFSGFDEYVGETVCAKIKGGAIKIKDLYPGTEPGKYILSGAGLAVDNEPRLENVELEWCSCVHAMIWPPRKKK